MKKTFRILLVIYAVILFIPIFSSMNNEVFTNKVYAEKKMENTIDIQISQNINALDQNKTVKIIQDVMNEFNSDIFFTKHNNNRYDKYIYLTSHDYLSTTHFEYNKKITLLTSSQFMVVKPLEEIINQNSLSGLATVRCQKKQEEMIVHKLSALLDCDINKIDDTRDNININIFVILTIFSFTVLLSIIIIYDQFHKYKLFSIKKLHGYSYTRIWWHEIKPILLNQSIILFTVITISSLVVTRQMTTDTFQLMYRNYKVILMTIIITFIIASIISIGFRKINIISYLKGNHISKKFIFFNSIVLFLLIFMSLSLFSQGKDYAISIISKINNHEQWETMKDYYIVPMIQQPDAQPEIAGKQWLKDNKNLFIELNHKGSIFADFDDFVDDGSIVDGYYYESRVGYVNNEYLKQNNVVDRNNKIIQVDNNEISLVILLPDNHKYQEEFIIKDAKTIDYENVKILYYKSDIPLFTYNTRINNHYSNSLQNIVLYVRTDKNGFDSDYDRVLAYKNNPFKIKVKDKNELKDILSKHHLDSYYIGCTTAYDDMAQLQNNEIVMFSLILVSCTIIVVLITKALYQQIYAYISIYQKKIAVKYIHGYSTFKIYKYFIFIHIIGFIILDILMILLKFDVLYTQFAIALVMIYWGIILYLCIYSRRKIYISQILKGEGL